MAYNDRITTSLHGRRFGLQLLSSAISGSGRGQREYAVGPDAFRADATTADTTSANLLAAGNSVLAVSSAGSSQVYTLDPPVPGTLKAIRGSTTDLVYVKTKNGEGIATSAGSSFTTIKLSSLGYGGVLHAMTTSLWLAVGLSTAAGHTLSTST